MPISPPRVCPTQNCTEKTYTKYCDKCRKANTKVYLVLGPSGSGKSTLVRENAKRGDLILDFDLIFQAISGGKLYDKPESLIPFVLAARQSIISLIGNVDGVANAWIIRNKITKHEALQLQAELGAELIVLKVSAEECKSRINKDTERPPEQVEQWHSRIDEWWVDHRYDW